MTELKTRAAKGGEYGINGSYYFGGQFLPSSEKTIKGAQRTSKGTGKPSKQEIAPYVWEVAPSTNHMSLYRQISHLSQMVNGELVSIDNLKAIAHYGHTVETLNAMITRWNNGERWMER